MRRFLSALFAVCPLVLVLCVLLLVADVAQACGGMAARRAARQERRSGACGSNSADFSQQSYSSCVPANTVAAPAPTEYVEKAWLAEKFPHVLREAESAGAVKRMPLASAPVIYFNSAGQCVGPNCPR